MYMNLFINYSSKNPYRDEQTFFVTLPSLFVLSNKAFRASQQPAFVLYLLKF